MSAPQMGGRALDTQAGEGRMYHGESCPNEPKLTGVIDDTSTMKVNPQNRRSCSLDYEMWGGEVMAPFPFFLDKALSPEKTGMDVEYTSPINEHESLKRERARLCARRLDGPLRQKGSAHG